MIPRLGALEFAQRVALEDMTGNFERRIAKIEEVLAKKAQEEELAKCNCGDPKRVFMPRPGVDMAVQLKAELALICPVHQERRLRRLLWAEIIGSDGKRIPNPKLDPIVEEYGRRYDRQFEQAPKNAAENV